MSYDRLLAELDCMTPGQAALFNQPETETYTGRAAAAIRALRAELTDLNYHYECAITDRDVANSELAEWVAQDERNLAELARAEEVNRAWAAENTWLSATLARVRELVRGRWVSVDDLQSALEGNQP